jgi:flagellar hook-associated protein 1 FlgK
MSLASILNIAQSALSAHQRAVSTSSHNIANASTEGYSRQRVTMQAALPVRTGQGLVGRGVETLGSTRARDRYIDAGIRRETGTLGQYDTMRSLLGQVEAVFGEPSDTGIAVALDTFFDAMGDLANDPSGAAPRALLREAGSALAQRFRATDARLGEIGLNVGERLRASVSEVNGLAARIGDVNRQILALGAEADAPDLEDQRDLLVDRLSGYMGVRVVEHQDGTLGVLAGDALLVDGATVQRLDVRENPRGGLAIGFAGSKESIDANSGSVAALVELSGNQVPAVRRQLDQLVAALVDEVNTLHRAGRTPAGLGGVDFFDGTGRTAGTIALDGRILQSTDNIAAGAGAGGGAGDGVVALSIAQLRTGGARTLGGQSLGEFYTGMVSSLGVITREAEQASAAQDTMLASLEAQRSSVSDVSVDEELVNLMRQQQAYAAASRLVTIANSMMDDVLRMV